jgi:hypothetical protein
MDFVSGKEYLIPVNCPACGGVVEVATFELEGDRFDCLLCETPLRISSMTPPALEVAEVDH